MCLLLSFFPFYFNSSLFFWKILYCRIIYLLLSFVPFYFYSPLFFLEKIILQNNISRKCLIISIFFNKVLMSAASYCSAAKQSNSVMPFLVKPFRQGLWFLKFCRNRVIRQTGRFAVLVSIRTNIPSSGFHMSFFRHLAHSRRYLAVFDLILKFVCRNHYHWCNTIVTRPGQIDREVFIDDLEKVTWSLWSSFSKNLERVVLRFGFSNFLINKRVSSFHYFCPV